jgi:hypothetical protein
MYGCFVLLSGMPCPAGDLGHGGIRVTLVEMYSYAVFTNAYAHFENATDIITVENYDRFLDMLAEEYHSSLSSDERLEVMRFFDSSTGKKWLGMERQLNVWMRLAKEVDRRVAVWSCPRHKDVMMSKSGQCPICEHLLEEVSRSERDPGSGTENGE